MREKAVPPYPALGDRRGGALRRVKLTYRYPVTFAKFGR